MLELRQLRQFVAVAEELHFRRAAMRLHMTQPPLTVAMRQLEDVVGTRLLERSRHGVKLTEAGQRFLDEARYLLAQADRAVAVARRGPEGISGILRFSSISSANLGIVPHLLSRFRTEYPSVELHITSVTSVRQVELLRHGDVDLGLIIVPLQDSRGLDISVLGEEEIALAVPAGHPIASRTRIAVGMLAADRFIIYPAPENVEFEGVLIAACQRAGFYPRVAQHASQMLTKLALVESGFGLTIVPACMRKVCMPGIRYLQIVDGRKPLSYTLALASRANGNSPLVNAFVSMAERVCKTYPFIGREAASDR